MVSCCVIATFVKDLSDNPMMSGFASFRDGARACNYLACLLGVRIHLKAGKENYLFFI